KFSTNVLIYDAQKINPSLFDFGTVNDFMTYRTTICSTLLELHVTLTHMQDCLCILDGRFDQLRILYITFHHICFEFSETKHNQKLLTNLRIFSLCCEAKIYSYDKSIVPLLRRMLNLEELDLNLIVKSYRKFIDGDTLKKDIITYIPRLYKFTFNICSIIDHRDQN
ncbi:unnamed protein product, partial [Rotaria sordida]